MRQLLCQLCYTRCQVSFYLWEIRPVLKHCKCSKILWPGLYVVSNQLVGYVSFSLILASVEVVHSCSAKQMYRKILKTLPSLCCSHFVTSCRPKSCNCVKIETPAQVFFSNFCEFSQNSLLQINREEYILEMNHSSKVCHSAVLLKLSEKFFSRIFQNLYLKEQKRQNNIFLKWVIVIISSQRH